MGQHVYEHGGWCDGIFVYNPEMLPPLIEIAQNRERKRLRTETNASPSNGTSNAASARECVFSPPTRCRIRSDTTLRDTGVRTCRI
jgi:hypothetical protein